MFKSLSDKLVGIFGSLTSKGRITEHDLEIALQHIKNEFLEADVNQDIIKPFLDNIKTQALGNKVLQSITPGQQIIKITNDEIVKLLGGETGGGESFKLTHIGFETILLAGLQGSGKTTSAAKLALHLKVKYKRNPLLVSLDTKRAAAQSQLQQLGESNNLATLPIIEHQSPNQITKRALEFAKLQGYDTVILDSAGRLQIDQSLMHELQEVQRIAKPKETLLVADAMMGQSAADMALSFHKQLHLSGIILTRIDGDARGGAALSMRAVSGVPIRFFGTGEKSDAWEEFNALSLANRILGMGDIVSLVERAEQALEADEADMLSETMARGEFTMDDMSRQLRQLQKMGGMSGIMSMMPGMGAMKKKMAGNVPDDSVIDKYRAVISSMTLAERCTPKIIHASRKKRIARGSGTQVQDVNKLLKQHLIMSKMAKKLKSMDKNQAMQSIESLMGNQKF